MFINNWIEAYLIEDFLEQPHVQLACSTILETIPTYNLQEDVRVSLRKLQDRLVDISSGNAKSRRDLEEPPKSLIPKKLKENWTLFDISPIEVARQMTIIGNAYFTTFK